MSGQDRNLEQVILQKIRALPPERIGLVEDFIDFLIQRGEDRLLTRAASALSEASFQNVWDNSEDADYELV